MYIEGKGSGLFGSITAEDLVKMAPAAPAAGAPAAAGQPAASYIDIPVTNIRSTIAKRLLQSKTQIPHYYLTVECNIDKLAQLRESYNKKLEKSGVKLSVNDFIIKATAVASKKVSGKFLIYLDWIM